MASSKDIDELITQADLNAKEDTVNKGAANGYAPLDGNAKVPISNMQVEFMEFEGNWNASTNTPTLANTDTDKQGTVYRVSVAGTHDFGAGNVVFGIGEWCVNDGTIWDQSPEASGPAIFGESTGILTGGNMSTGTASDEFSIVDGTAQFVDKAGVKTTISFSGHQDVVPTNIGTQLITFVGINNAGALVESSAAFTSVELKTVAVLGVVVHVDLTTVDAVNQETIVAYNTGTQLVDLADGIGFFNVDGNVIGPNGANLLVNKTNGIIYKKGSNYAINADAPDKKTLSTLTGATFQYRFNNGDNGVTGTAFDPDNLDDGIGGLTALSNNKWSVQRVYSFTSNNLKLQRGVASFDSQEKAIAGIETEGFTTEASIKANGLLRGWIVAKKGITVLNNTSLAVFIEAPKFQSGGASAVSLATDLQGAFDNSSDPEIVIPTGLDFSLEADTDGAEIIQNWKDEAQAVTASMTGDGELLVKELEVTGVAHFGTEVDNGSSGAADTIDWNAGNKQKSTLSATVTYTFTDPPGACNVLLKVIQDSTPRTITWPASVKWPGGTAPTISTGSGDIDIMAFYFDGTNYYGQASLDFS